MVGVESHVASIDNHVVRVENRVAGLDDRVVSLDNRMVGVESHVASIDNRVAGIDSNLSEFRRELEDKIDRANNRTVGYMALMFGAVGVIVGLITYF